MYFKQCLSYSGFKTLSAKHLCKRRIGQIVTVETPRSSVSVLDIRYRGGWSAVIVRSSAAVVCMRINQSRLIDLKKHFQTKNNFESFSNFSNFFVILSAFSFCYVFSLRVISRVYHVFTFQWSKRVKIKLRGNRVFSGIVTVESWKPSRSLLDMR